VSPFNQAFQNVRKVSTFSRDIATEYPAFHPCSEPFVPAGESVQYGLDRWIDAGDYVVTPFTNRLCGRDGIELQAQGTWVWTFRDGAIVGISPYQELQEALEAAGLRSSPALGETGAKAAA
jgi:hypothetical protein